MFIRKENENENIKRNYIMFFAKCICISSTYQKNKDRQRLLLQAKETETKYAVLRVSDFFFQSKLLIC